MEELSILPTSNDGKALLIALFATVFGGIILRWFSANSKLSWSYLHGHTYLVPFPANTQAESPPTDQLYETQSFYFYNAGRAPAKNIEIIFNFKPQHFELFPVIPYKVSENPDGRTIVSIESLGHKESFNIEQIAAGTLPTIINVRTESGQAVHKEFWFLPKPPKWHIWLIQGLAFLGILSLLYHGIKRLIE